MLPGHGLTELRVGNNFCLGQTEDGLHGISFEPALAQFDQIHAEVRAASASDDHDPYRIRKLHLEFGRLKRRLKNHLADAAGDAQIRSLTDELGLLQLEARRMAALKCGTVRTRSRLDKLERDTVTAREAARQFLGGGRPFESCHEFAEPFAKSAVLPSAMPAFTSDVLCALEKAVLASVSLGLVGAGGFGIEFNVAMELFHYEKAALIILLIFAPVVSVKQVSNCLRAKTIGGD